MPGCFSLWPVGLVMGSSQGGQVEPCHLLGEIIHNDPSPWTIGALGERRGHPLFLFPLPPLEQHGVAKAACGRHFTHLGPSSAIHGWVVDLPLRVCFHTLTLEVLRSSRFIGCL